MGGTESESQINRTQKLQFALQRGSKPTNFPVTKDMPPYLIFIDCGGL